MNGIVRNKKRHKKYGEIKKSASAELSKYKPVSKSPTGDLNIRYASFIGWNTQPSIGAVGHLIANNHWEFMQNFLFLWSTGSGIRDALNGSAPNGPLNHSVNVSPSDLTVFGYQDLGYNQAD